MGDYCHKKQLEYQEKGLVGRREIIPGAILNAKNTDEPQAKRLKIDNLIERNIAFFRAHYTDGMEIQKVYILKLTFIFQFFNYSQRSTEKYSTLLCEQK